MRMESGEKRGFGLEVEARAERWFLARYPGARLVARNFTCKTGEIDLIFQEGEESGELIFVEVRARAGDGWVSGIESVTYRKRKRLERAIGVFLSRYRGPARSLRVDVLAFETVRDSTGARGTWTHYPNVRLD